jgi:hypothetical protein
VPVLASHAAAATMHAARALQQHARMHRLFIRTCLFIHAGSCNGGFLHACQLLLMRACVRAACVRTVKIAGPFSALKVRLLKYTCLRNNIRAPVAL